MHPSKTPEFWESYASDERAFAKDPAQTVESKQIHLGNARAAEEIAKKLRAGTHQISDFGQLVTK